MVNEYPDDVTVRSVCKIGQEKECCRYLSMAPGGWSCEKYGELRSILDQRVIKDEMVAQGDNCEGMKSR